MQQIKWYYGISKSYARDYSFLPDRFLLAETRVTLNWVALLLYKERTAWSRISEPYATSAQPKWNLLAIGYLTMETQIEVNAISVIDKERNLK